MFRSLALVFVLTLTCGCFDARLGLRNDTPDLLVPYPVVTNPPPPHRMQADSPVFSGQLVEIDIEGFNPLFFAPYITDPNRPNAVFVGLALATDDPPLLQWQLLHYAFPPDQVGSDPAKQPVVLRAETVEVPNEDLVLRVSEGPSDQEPFVTWSVELEVQN